MNVKDMYAFTGIPSRIGTYIVVINTPQSKKEQFIKCLALPSMENEHITFHEFVSLLQDDLIDLVDTLPDEVYEVCKAQYDANNRIYEEIDQRFDNGFTS